MKLIPSKGLDRDKPYYIMYDITVLCVMLDTFINWVKHVHHIWSACRGHPKTFRWKEAKQKIAEFYSCQNKKMQIKEGEVWRTLSERPLDWSDIQQVKRTQRCSSEYQMKDVSDITGYWSPRPSSPETERVWWGGWTGAGGERERVREVRGRWGEEVEGEARCTERAETQEDIEEGK